MFKDLKIRGQIMWGILMGTLAITAIHYLLQPAIAFGVH